MKIAPNLTGFFCGLLAALTLTAVAQDQGQPVAPTAPAPKEGSWEIAQVDEGMIRAKNASEATPTDRDDKTRDDVKKRTRELMDDGFEPYSAGVYNGGTYNNEYVFFFRKHVR